MDTEVREDRGLSQVVECVITALSWILQFGYTVVLIERLTPSPRGKKPVLVVRALVFCSRCLKAKIFCPCSIETI